MSVKPYSYVDPTTSKVVTYVCPDIYDKSTKDEIRLLIGNLFTFKNLGDTGLETLVESPVSDGRFTALDDYNLEPNFLDLETATSETGYEIVNINIAENPYISHAEMSTTRIDTIDPTTILPNFKIPMRMYGSDPTMEGGDQFWYTYFMGGELFGATYERKLDNSTIFYDEAFRLALPYNDLEKMVLNSDSVHGEKTISDGGIDSGIADSVSLTTLLSKDAYGVKLDTISQLSLLSVKPRMVYYNHWIGKYVPWTQNLSTERLIPNHSVYESFVETGGSAFWSGHGPPGLPDWFIVRSYQPNRLRFQIGDEMYSYVAQWDLPNNVANIKADTPVPLSPIYSGELSDFGSNPNTGQTAIEAKTDIIEKVCTLFGTDQKSYFHKWKEQDRYLANTASCAEYLYYYSLNSFSASTLDHVSKRNENIFFTWPHWRWSYQSKGPDPDQPIYGLFPYYAKILFPTHMGRREWSDSDFDDAGKAISWWMPSTKISDGDIILPSSLKKSWEENYEFLLEMVQHNFSSKFIETLKDLNDENWSPLHFTNSELVKGTMKLDVAGELTTTARPGKARASTHQALKIASDTSQPSYRMFDYMEFLTSIYNNPTEALNTNYMFMGGDNSFASISRAEMESTHKNDGMHRYFNSSASIGTINNSARRVLKSYDLMMNRMIETDETIGDGDITDDYYTIKGFLEPNLRHSEVLAYRIEKIGGHTTGDQTNQNVIQNFWSINDPLPNDTEAALALGGTPPLGFCQIFDSQLKYGGDYTYNIYAYVLTLGYKYRYGDFRLTRQLSYSEDDGKYCLEFYDPFTMERASQQFKMGEGLLTTRGVSDITGLLSYFTAGPDADFDTSIFGGETLGSLSEVMQSITQFDGTPGVPSSVGHADEMGTSAGGAESVYPDFTMGYHESVSLYTDDQWAEAMSELNRMGGTFLRMLPIELASLDSSIFESTIWQEIGLAGNHTLSGRYESIFEQLGKLGGFMRMGARKGTGLSDEGMTSPATIDPEYTTMDYDGLVYREPASGVVGTIESSALARLSGLGVSSLEVTSHPFLMDYNIYIEPCLKVYEIPMTKRKISMTDNPASPANAIPFQHIDDSKKIGFHCMYESHTGDSLGIPYPPALSSEEVIAKGKYLDSMGVKLFEELPADKNSKSPQRYLEVFRTDTPPKSYLDFEGKLLKRTDLKIEESEFSAEDFMFSDKIKENKKYYYLIRFKNDLDVPGWPSPIMEVELVNDGGYNYAIFNEYELNTEEDKSTQLSKAFKKLLQVQPNLSHLTMATENLDFSRTAGSQLENLNVGVAKEGTIWDKKFKIRLISKKTGKKIDLNIKFNLKEENKFVTGVETASELETTYEP